MVIFYSYVKLPEGSPKGLPMMCTKWKPFSYTCFYRAFFFSETSTVWHSYERRTSREAAVCIQTTARKHWKSFTCLFFLIDSNPQLSYQRKFNPPRAFKRTAGVQHSMRPSARVAKRPLGLLHSPYFMTWYLAPLGLIGSGRCVALSLQYSYCQPCWSFCCLTWGVQFHLSRLCSHRIYGAELLP